MSCIDLNYWLLLMIEGVVESRGRPLGDELSHVITSKRHDIYPELAPALADN